MNPRTCAGFAEYILHNSVILLGSISFKFCLTKCVFQWFSHRFGFNRRKKICFIVRSPSANSARALYNCNAAHETENNAPFYIQEKAACAFSIFYSAAWVSPPEAEVFVSPNFIVSYKTSPPFSIPTSTIVSTVPRQAISYQKAGRGWGWGEGVGAIEES